jgi:hypothetical protein
MGKHVSAQIRASDILAVRMQFSFFVLQEFVP